MNQPEASPAQGVRMASAVPNWAAADSEVLAGVRGTVTPADPGPGAQVRACFILELELEQP